MKRYHVLLLVGAILVAVLVLPQLDQAGAARSQDESKGKSEGSDRPRPGSKRFAGMREEEAAIRKAAAEFSMAFNKGQAKALVERWTEDGEFIHESGKVYRGRAALEALFQKALASYKGYKQTLKIDSIRFVSPTVALDEGTVTMLSPEGASDVGRYTSVWAKQDGKWLLSQVRDLPDLDEPDQAPAYTRLKQLAWMVGEWQDKDSKINVKMNCKWGPGQTFLIQEFAVRQPDGKESTVTQYIGYDPYNDQIRSWTFDSGGGFSASWWTREGNTWQLDTEGVYPDGKQTTAQESLKFVDDNQVVWASRNREVEEQPLADLEITFVRKTKTP